MTIHIFSLISSKITGILKTFQNIIFDLDGTLTNPYTGILNSLRYALGKLNFEKIPDSVPPEFIGPPLQQCFKQVFGLNEKLTEIAIAYFREYYGSQGLYENYPYDGIVELLSALNENGVSMYVATSKYEKYAWEIVRHFELDKYIRDLSGADYKGSKTKADHILDIMTRYRLCATESLMVGDTVFDIAGAKEAGISVLSVGYGFAAQHLLMDSQPDYFAGSVEELTELFLE